MLSAVPINSGAANPVPPSVDVQRTILSAAVASAQTKQEPNTTILAAVTANTVALPATADPEGAGG